MIDPASVSATIAGLKFAKDTLQVMLGLKVEASTQAAVVDAMSKLVAAQETILRLQAETDELRRNLNARDDWDSRKARYSLTKTVGGAIVYESTFPMHHFACPACFEKHEVQILQDCGGVGGTFQCSACKVFYPIRAPQPIRVERATSSGNAWGDDDRY